MPAMHECGLSPPREGQQIVFIDRYQNILLQYIQYKYIHTNISYWTTEVLSLIICQIPLGTGYFGVILQR
jgi:hypothetical protein